MPALYRRDLLSVVPVFTSGAAVANNALSAESASVINVATHLSNRTDAIVQLTGTLSAATASGGTFEVVARPYVSDGTVGVNPPTFDYRPFTIAVLYPPPTGTNLVLIGSAVDLPPHFSLYVANVSTGVTLQAGWTLSLLPRGHRLDTI